MKLDLGASESLFCKSGRCVRCSMDFACILVVHFLLHLFSRLCSQLWGSLRNDHGGIACACMPSLQWCIACRPPGGMVPNITSHKTPVTRPVVTNHSSVGSLHVHYAFERLQLLGHTSNLELTADYRAYCEFCSADYRCVSHESGGVCTLVSCVGSSTRGCLLPTQEPGRCSFCTLVLVLSSPGPTIRASN